MANPPEPGPPRAAPPAEPPLNPNDVPTVETPKPPGGAAAAEGTSGAGARSRVEHLGQIVGGSGSALDGKVDIATSDYPVGAAKNAALVYVLMQGAGWVVKQTVPRLLGPALTATLGTAAGTAGTFLVGGYLVYRAGAFSKEVWDRFHHRPPPTRVLETFSVPGWKELRKQVADDINAPRRARPAGPASDGTNSVPPGEVTPGDLNQAREVLKQPAPNVPPGGDVVIEPVAPGAPGRSLPIKPRPGSGGFTSYLGGTVGPGVSNRGGPPPQSDPAGAPADPGNAPGGVTIVDTGKVDDDPPRAPGNAPGGVTTTNPGTDQGDPPPVPGNAPGGVTIVDTGNVDDNPPPVPGNAPGGVTTTSPGNAPGQTPTVPGGPLNVTIKEFGGGEIHRPAVPGYRPQDMPVPGKEGIHRADPKEFPEGMRGDDGDDSGDSGDDSDDGDDDSDDDGNAMGNDGDDTDHDGNAMSHDGDDTDDDDDSDDDDDDSDDDGDDSADMPADVGDDSGGGDDDSTDDDPESASRV